MPESQESALLSTGPGPGAGIDLTILVPVYNEAGNILPLTEEILAAYGPGGAAPNRYEILFVDDGSDDSTLAEVKDAQSRYAHVRVLHHHKRAGKSRALVTGFLAARGAWIQTLDGDRQNDPNDAAQLWRSLHVPAPSTELGVVAGVRKRRNDGIVKFFSSRIANRLRRWLLNDPTIDTGCGFKLLRASAARRLPYFDGMHRFLPALIAREGYQLMQIPVEDRPRIAGVSKYGFFGRLGAGIFDLLGVLWLKRRASLTTSSEIARPPK